MKWVKKGLIYSPDGSTWWARSYAHLPTAEVGSSGKLVVYFDSLDERQFGRIGYVELDPEDPARIVRLTADPILDLGDPGCFDDSGVNPSCVLDVNGEKFLYYIGWQRAERVPYMLFTGLALSRDGGTTFDRSSRVPILDRTPEEPYSRSAPCVRLEGRVFRMWYWSCVGWSVEGSAIRYNNVIKYAESSDGFSWPSQGHTCLTPRAAEYSLGRPWVIKDGSVYRMWTSVRSSEGPYHYIAYAESSNGIDWLRKDERVGIGPSEVQGWDSDTVCFACVVDVGSRRCMFYNGNHNGQTGFGYAELFTG